MSFDTKVNKQWELHDAMFSNDRTDLFAGPFCE